MMMLDKSLRKALLSLLGPERCLFAPEDRLPYSLDASHFRQQPDVVLLPENSGEIAAIMQLANARAMPVTPRGAGSGLTGGAVPAHGGAVLSFDRMNRILEVDADNFIAVVQPGVITEALNIAARAHGLFFAPDPASVAFSTIGGNIAENAGGMRAVKYGVTKHAILDLEVVTPTGSIIRTGSKCFKDVVGYGLTELFVASEGTLGIVSEAVCKLVPLPETKSLVAAFFPDMRAAAGAVPAIIRRNLQPSALEFLDKHCLDAVRSQMACHIPPAAKAQLLVEVDGRRDETLRKVQEVRELCLKHRALSAEAAHDQAGQDALWKARRSLHNALMRICSQWFEEDISVPVGRIAAMLDKLEYIRREHSLRMICFGHFGDGNLHLSYAGEKEPLSPEQGREVRANLYEAVASLEGRIASEHGIGMAKAASVGWNLSPETIELMRGLKRLLDPNDILNPGKCFPQAETQHHA